MNRVILLLLAAFPAMPALADEFLGEEPAEAAPEAAPEEKPAAAKERKATPRASTRADKTAPAPDSGDFTFSGGLGAGTGHVSGQATVGYSLNRWTGVEGTYSYFRFDSGDSAGEQYGPEVDLVIRLPNPSIVTPFVGAGPGYVKWERLYKDEVFDAGAAVTANAFAGINIRLTRHFGIQAVRKQTRYLQDPPKSFADRETREADMRIATNVGFHVSF